jgi:hypothetical protein
VGDFNGDGRADLAVANSGDGTVSVLLGNGDGTFQPQQVFDVGISPDALAVGDFNGDGLADLAVANFDDLTVSVLLGNGDGTFQPQQLFDPGSTVTALAVGDFNGDGLADLAVANSGDGSGDGTVSVLLGNGDGTFQPPRVFAVGNDFTALAVGDFNGDGRADLAVVDSGTPDSHGIPIPGTGGVSVLLGNGDGTFQPQRVITTEGAPDAILSGDFNRDGRADLVVANFNDGTVSVLLGNGDGSFHTRGAFAAGASVVALAAADFNGDGLVDLAVVNAGANAVSILLGNGQGDFGIPLGHPVNPPEVTIVSVVTVIPVAPVASRSQVNPSVVSVSPTPFGQSTSSNTAVSSAAEDGSMVVSAQVDASDSATLGLIESTAASLDAALEAALAGVTSETAVSVAFSALAGAAVGQGQAFSLDGAGLALFNSLLTTRLDTTTSTNGVDPASDPLGPDPVFGTAFSTLVGGPTSPIRASLTGKTEGDGATGSGRAGQHERTTGPAVTVVVIIDPWERAMLRLDEAFERAGRQFRERVLDRPTASVAVPAPPRLRGSSTTPDSRPALRESSLLDAVDAAIAALEPDTTLPERAASDAKTAGPTDEGLADGAEAVGDTVSSVTLDTGSGRGELACLSLSLGLTALTAASRLRLTPGSRGPASSCVGNARRDRFRGGARDDR